MVTRTTDDEYDWVQTQVALGPIFLTVGRQGRRERWMDLWAGPVGLHVFLPDVWNSRPDFCSTWREPIK